MIYYKRGCSALLFESLQEMTNAEMQNGCGNFMEQVEIVCQSESTYPEIYRMLSINYKK